MKPLLRSRCFAPFFWTQFLGAFNDNVFKNTIIVYVGLQHLSEADTGYWVNLASGVFILPFMIFSPLAGSLADKLEKSALVRRIKLCEVVLMVLGSLAYMSGNLVAMIVILFGMGVQSTFFGPIKYSLLPHHLPQDAIMRATGWVEMGTFVSILLGLIFGDVLGRYCAGWVPVALIGGALLGWVAAWSIPPAGPADPELELGRNLIRAEWSLWCDLRRHHPAIYAAILAISWYWFCAATVMAQLPTMTQHNMGAPRALIFFLGIFILSVGTGSLVVYRFGRGGGRVRTLLLGYLGMACFQGDLGYLTHVAYGPEHPLRLFGLGDEAGGGGWALLRDLRLVLDLAAMGWFSSFFIVPLYAFLQQGSPRRFRSRIIALTNLASSVFMVLSALFSSIIYALGQDAGMILGLSALLCLPFGGTLIRSRKRWAPELRRWMRRERPVLRRKVR